MTTEYGGYDGGYDLTRAERDLDDLLDWLDELRDDLVPGTPRRWGAREADPDEPVDSLAGFGISKAPAPLRVDVLDVLLDVEVSVRELTEEVVEKLDRTGPDVSPGSADLVRLRWLRSQLPAIADDGDLAEHVGDELHRLLVAVSRAVGRFLPSTTLDSTCPLCGGHSRLKVNHDRGEIACPDCGMVWTEAGTGPASWSWLSRLLGAEPPERLYDATEAAAIAGVSPATVRCWKASGVLPVAGRRGPANVYRISAVLDARDAAAG